MRTHCMVAVYESSLYGNTMRDQCMVAVYERSLGGCI